MQHDEVHRRSRWIIRAMEWDEPKARYPNVWVDGMPRQLFVLERVACRLRLGDLVVTYHPAGVKHVERSERYVGISRIAALRRAEQPGSAWVELETAFRFDPPLALDPAPRRVFLCCDPGWPEAEVELFRRVMTAAVEAGWRPHDDEREPAVAGPRPAAHAAVATTAAERGVEIPVDDGADQPLPARPSAPPRSATAPEPRAARTAPRPRQAAPLDVRAERLSHTPLAVSADGVERWFAGADFGGDMRDPRRGTWLAVVGLTGERLKVLRLDALGRSGLEARLRDPDAALQRSEAIGLDFPFALPLGFAEALLGGPFPEEGWWALVKRLEHISRPDFLTRVHEFREVHGEVKRLADETAHADSPLHRACRDLSAMTYHGLRMIGEDRSRYAVRPFETAQARLLLEVRPEVTSRRLGLDGLRPGLAPARLAALSCLPLDLGDFARACNEGGGAVAALLAARSAALAVVTGETARSPDELAPGHGDRVRREGWIYGLDPA